MHVMIDLETWGVSPGSDLRSIGAVTFDPVAGTICAPVKAFYVATRNGDNYGLHSDPATVAWWHEQSPEAQNAFVSTIDLRAGLVRFMRWLNDLSNETFASDDKTIKIWCKGPHFDIAILDAAYRAVDLKTPWHYRAPRDMRTITDIAGITYDEEKAMFTGTPHNALDDAVSQAKVVCEAYRRLGYGPAQKEH